MREYAQRGQNAEKSNAGSSAQRPSENKTKNTKSGNGNNINTKSNISRQERVRRVKRNRKILALSVFIVVAVTVFVSLSLTVFFRIRTVNVAFEGKVRYTAEEITEASSIGYNSVNIFRLNEEVVSDSICKRLPYVKSVTIKKVFPYTVTLNVTEAKVKAAVKTNSGFLLIANDGKALGYEKKADKYPKATFAKDAVYVCGNKIQSTESDKKLEKYELNLAQLFESLNNNLAKAGIKKITGYNLSDTENLSVEYDSRIDLKIGNYDYIEDKLRLAEASLKKLDEESTNLKGELNLKEHRDAVFSEYKQ